MREMLFNTPLTGIVICLACYEVGMQLRRRFDSPILNPMLIGILLSAVVISVCGIPLESFKLGSDMINLMLTPATVVLGLSVYNQRQVLQQNFVPVVGGCLAGSLVNVALMHGLCRLFLLEDALLYSLLPRSVTTPIAVALSEQGGGLVGVTAVCVIVSGITGAVLAPTLAKLLRLEDEVAVGVAVGTSSHAAGTTTAVQMGELTGAMSGVSIGVAGLLTVVLALFW
ncbi:MAG: LrgB family protein [Oscillospiraceae bacterium]|nr:LrgB family protein [Oscillospiraceae bacterium]